MFAPWPDVCGLISRPVSFQASVKSKTGIWRREMKHEILLHSRNYEQDGNVRSAFLNTRATAAGTSKVGFLATGTNLVNTAMKPGKNLPHPFCHSDHCEQRTQACFPSSGLVRKSEPKSLPAGLQNEHGQGEWRWCSRQCGGLSAGIVCVHCSHFSAPC